MTESVVWVAGVGAVAGLGAALARRFAREGYRVAVSGRSLDKLQAVVAQIEASGGKANAVVADSGVEADVLAAIAQVNQLGTLKAAIFNVGNAVSAPALELSAELFEQTWRASTLGGFCLPVKPLAPCSPMAAAACCLPGPPRHYAASHRTPRSQRARRVCVR